MRKRRAQGFSLVELAVVLVIVSLLLGSLLYTFAAQVEQRNRNETEQRLAEARELLLGYAIVNGRLPCPASNATNGIESPTIGSGACTNYLDGFLPAVTIGFKPIDSFGYGIDSWGNRLRYALAQNATTVASTCAAPTSPAFSVRANMISNGISCAPSNLVVCDATQNTDGAVLPPSCGTPVVQGDARSVTNQNTIVAIVYSTGRNGAQGPGGSDEAENVDGDGVFVLHDVRPKGATGGEFDDQMTWIPIGLLHGRMVAAGVLP